MDDDITARARRATIAVVATVAATVIAVIAAGAGLVLLLGHHDRTVSPPDRAWPSSTVDTGADVAEPSTAASPPAANDLTWTTVAGARLPVSATAGPRDTAGGRAYGFAHSGLGAVFAAAHLSVRLSPQVGPDVFVPTLREQVTGDVAALGQQLDDDYEQARAALGLPYGQPAGRLHSTARGYRVDLNTPAGAEVRLLIEGPGTAGATVLVEVRLHVHWIDTDWVLVAPPGGTWDEVTAPVNDTTGYTRFPDGG